MWKRYFGELYGLIYVVDASKHERIEEGRAVLEKVMEHPKITQKPILMYVWIILILKFLQWLNNVLLTLLKKHEQLAVCHRLGNKQDVEGAMDEIDIVQGLGIESLANKTKTPCRVVSNK